MSVKLFSYDVDSLFFIFLSGHQTLLYVYDKTNYQLFKLFFLPSSYMQTLYYFIAWLKIRYTISLAIVLTIMFVYTFFLLMDNLVIVKLTPSTFIISPSLIWSREIITHYGYFKSVSVHRKLSCRSN